MDYQHTPVMLKEVLEILNPKPGENYIDCTLGGSGYSLAIAKRIFPGRILSFDLDEAAIKNAEEIIKKQKIKNIILANDNFSAKGGSAFGGKNLNIILVNDNFKNLSNIVNKYFEQKEISKINGIVFDLGLSLFELKDRSRGFSFKFTAPLIMSYGKESENSVIDIINNNSKEQLEKIIRQYGEEKFASTIASNIVIERRSKKITNTDELVRIINYSVPKKYLSSHLHPATRTFQALRIAANNELDNLSLALPQAVKLLAAGGKIAVISYHSLEDRLVKRFFREESRGCLCPPTFPACRCHHQARLKILTKGVIRPTEEEVTDNPHSRSAKLRLAEKL